MNLILVTLLIAPLLLVLDLWTAPRPERAAKLKGEGRVA
jgi:hypothetical protein